MNDTCAIISSQTLSCYSLRSRRLPLYFHICHIRKYFIDTEIQFVPPYIGILAHFK